MLTLTVPDAEWPIHQSEEIHVTYARPRTPSSPASTFMDIFACRQCKKSKRHRGRKYADNEGYSSNEDDYYYSTTQNKPKVKPPTQNKPKVKLPTEQGSLRRPLTCKAFGKRVSRRDTKSKPEDNTNSFIENTWRSLPNLRSPALAVRAMTLKFKSLTGKEDETTNKNSTGKPKKRARFNEAVDVIIHDDDGNALLTQSVKIKYDDDDSFDIDFSKMAAASGSESRDPDPHPSNMSPKPDMIRMDFMDIKRNPEGQKYFKCVISIGEQYDRRRITVRTAMGGSRLVLIAYKSEPLGDGTHYWRQFVEKFRLPHAIDPNQVNATMHSAGDLVIEAPLFEFEGDAPDDT